MAAVRSPLDEQLARLASGRHHDPFQILGSHREGREEVVRVFMPDVDSVTIEGPELPMKRRGESALFEWRGAPGRVPERYSLRWRDASGEASAHDAYAFGPQISDFDLHLFGEGSHRHAQRFLGAHPREVDGVAGVLFATWAPNAERISVVGDFNRWDGRRHPMRSRGGSGVWELFVPGVAPGDLYKLELRTRGGGAVVLKIDPYARRFQKRPQTAAVVEADSAFPWADAGWLARRREAAWQRTPMSVYEVHLGSWQREADGAFLDYETLAERLVDHVSSLGFTHVELLPVTEHPLDASWGYQTTGFFAPTSRFGSPDGLRTLIDRCHARGIGVILDWVPGHFPRDAHGLARFDGTAVYEHADPRRGEHRDWGTLIFNYGRNEVRSFLISSALYWIESFHLDGLRVDAVASMLYLDYSREPGDWVPNEYGGNENLDAIRFLRELNHVVQSTHPGVTVTAEESTAWPQVTRPPEVGGLGFAMKWNMGWMHDTLGYMSHDPVHRKHHHDRLTFGLLYAHTENYVLPFSHDEVVHGKGSLLAKMPGDDWQRFANLRLLYAYMFTYPGKKLLFMGSEFAQREEWSEVGTLDWGARHDPRHAGVERLVADLNGLYREHPPLHRFDFDSGRGFEWIDCHDYAQSIICYLRRDGAGGVVIVALNFTPVPRTGYRIGVPEPGDYAELINSDAALYGGSNLGNLGTVPAVEEPWMGRPCALTLTLPPLGAVVLRRVPAA